MKTKRFLLGFVVLCAFNVFLYAKPINLADYGISEVKDSKGKISYVYDKVEELEEGKTYKLLNMQRGKNEETFEQNCYWFCCYEGDNVYPSGVLQLYGIKENLQSMGYWYGKEITLEKLSNDGFKVMWTHDNVTIGPYRDKNVKKSVSHKVRSYRYDNIDIAAYGISVIQQESGDAQYVYDKAEELKSGTYYVWLNSRRGTDLETYGLENGCLFYLYELYEENGETKYRARPTASILFVDKSKAPYKYATAAEWTSFDGLKINGAAEVTLLEKKFNDWGWGQMNTEINRIVSRDPVKFSV